MIQKIKHLKVWQKVVGSLILLFLLWVILGVLSLSIKVNSSHANPPQDYYSYHGPRIVKLDQDMNSMVNDILAITQNGDDSNSTYQSLIADSSQVTADIQDLQAYDGDVPARFQQTDQLLSESLDKLSSAAGNIPLAELKAHTGDYSSFNQDAQDIIDGRNLYKQAADEMIRNK